MKLFFAGLVATAAAVCAVAVPAQAESVASVQAAPVDPLKALKAQLVPGKGVKITELSSITLDFTSNDQAMQVQVNTRTVGTLAFAKGNVATADLRVRMSSRQKGPNPPYRIIAEGRNAYVTNAGIAKALPSVVPGSSRRPVGPKTLSSTSASLQRNCSSCWTRHQKVAPANMSTPHSLTSGTTSPPGKATSSSACTSMNTTCSPAQSIDTTTYPDDDSTAYDQMAFHTDTKYSGWGAKVKIAAPAASKVISEKKLNAKTRKAVIKAGYPESSL